MDKTFNFYGTVLRYLLVNNINSKFLYFVFFISSEDLFSLFRLYVTIQLSILNAGSSPLVRCLFSAPSIISQNILNYYFTFQFPKVISKQMKFISFIQRFSLRLNLFQVFLNSSQKEKHNAIYLCDCQIKLLHFKTDQLNIMHIYQLLFINSLNDLVRFLHLEYK